MVKVVIPFMIQLNYRDSKPIYEQIKDGLKRLVITGAIATDEKLPSVRELASQLAINPRRSVNWSRRVTSTRSQAVAVLLQTEKIFQPGGMTNC